MRGRPRRKAATFRAYLCLACRHIFKTVKHPRTCEKCGGKLVLLDSYKASRKPKRGRRRWITPEDFYEKSEEGT